MDPIATNVGIDILNKGGNAIDASIAIATTLAVTSPNWSGLAGDSAWLYHDGKKNINVPKNVSSHSHFPSTTRPCPEHSLLRSDGANGIGTE